MMMSRYNPYARTAIQEDIMKKNVERRHKDTWLMETRGVINTPILINTATAIDSVKDIDDTFFPINKSSMAKKDEKARWLNLLQDQISRQAFTWRLLDRVSVDEYTRKYLLHCKTGAMFGELTNTGLTSLRTGQYVYALPPLNSHVNFSECHLFSLYNKSFAHPMLLDHTDLTALIDDCLQARRWVLFIKKLDELAEDQFLEEIPLLNDDLKNKFEREVDLYPPITKNNLGDIKATIRNEKPNCKNSSLFRWLEEYKLTIEEMANIYSYLTYMKPIGKVLSHVHPYNLATTNQKVNIGKVFRVKYE